MTFPKEEGQGSTLGDAVFFSLLYNFYPFIFLIIFSPLTSFPFFFTAGEVLYKKRSSSLPCFFPRLLYLLDMSADFPLAPAFNINIFLVMSLLSCRRYHRIVPEITEVKGRRKGSRGANHNNK